MIKGSPSESLHNDISIIFVNDEFKLDKHIDTICLPEIHNETEEGQFLTNCTVLGWGADDLKSDELEAVLGKHLFIE